MGLIKDIVKGGQEVTDPAKRESYGKAAGGIGIASNIALFIIKIIAGLLSNSIAVCADAVNNLSDAGSSIITLIGFKIAGKPADAEHPYGHARIEYVSGLIVSFMVTVIGVQLLTDSIDKISAPDKTVYTLLTFVILVVSVFMKIGQYIIYRRIGKIINSVTLSATAADSLSDVITTVVVLFGALVSGLTGVTLDGWLGVAVALFIIYNGIKLIIETSSPLLGTAPDKELTETISKKIMSYSGVIGLHDLVVHNYGPERCFASVHVEVPANRDIMISHDIIDNIEFDFYRDLKIHLVCHLDPVETDNEEINRLRAEVLNIVKSISPIISMHDFRVVFGTTHTNLIFDVTLPVDAKVSDHGLSHLISDKIRELDPSYNTVITVDRDYTSTININDKQ